MQELFGHEDLRPGQRSAIEAVLAGRDTLAIMSTGSGKSAIYQVCGAVIEGTTVVVSPLIALQHDQVLSLEGEEAGRPVQLDSTLSKSARERLLEEIGAGEVEFVFLAPEQLLNEETLASVRASAPSLVVVDEAHCVSTWGHDFRPAYAQLGDAIDALGRPTVLCLTATAAPPVREDIISSLRLRDPAIVVRGFDRPNIELSVERYLGGDDRDAAVVAAAAELPGAGIVYVATRRRTEELAARIAERRAVTSYHGAMKRADRDEAQERFVGGQVDVIVATNAFGMGIDKPDVRWILHADLPDSLDAYYQEVGRAGRDGEPAAAVLHYVASDVGRRRFQVSRGDDEARAALLASRLEMMRSYAESTTCRRGQVLAYFGEPFEPPCDGCDNCRAHAAAPAESGAAGEDEDEGLAGVAGVAGGELIAGVPVRHASWGDGTVLEVAGDRLTVLFDAVGYRNLSLAVVTEEGLLEPVVAAG